MDPRGIDGDEDLACKDCGSMDEHGWIDTPEGGQVCPGDYVITGKDGELHSMKPNKFAEDYMPAPTEVFIDCEWNGYGGTLISMALVDIEGRSLYLCTPLQEEAVPWVDENVIPVLGSPTFVPDMLEFSMAIQEFLKPYDEIEIISDWPEDIERFCHALIVGPGERIRTPTLSMRIIRYLDSDESAIPHNALEDARAIRGLWLSLLSDM